MSKVEHVRFQEGTYIELDTLAPDEFVTANVDRGGWDVWRGDRDAPLAEWHHEHQIIESSEDE